MIGRDFLEEEKKLYGAHGVYAADPFHESQPPVDTPEYLRAVGNAIHKLFNDFDPNSIWAMQAWSLREPIVKAVPKENLLILDLNGAKSQQENACWGYPLVAGNLHNFGGRINLHGDLRLLASNQYVNAVKRIRMFVVPVSLWSLSSKIRYIMIWLLKCLSIKMKSISKNGSAVTQTVATENRPKTRIRLGRIC